MYGIYKRRGSKPKRELIFQIFVGAVLKRVSCFLRGTQCGIKIYFYNNGTDFHARECRRRFESSNFHLKYGLKRLPFVPLTCTAQFHTNETTERPLRPQAKVFLALVGHPVSHEDLGFPVQHDVDVLRHLVPRLFLRRLQELKVTFPFS